MAEALNPTSALAPGTVLTVRVRAMASSGAGIGDLPDGRVVFVHRTAPGDEAEVVIERVRPRWATGRLERVMTPGPARVEAPCPRYDTCGGCALQHLSYEEQLAWKGRFVADALERIGGFRVPPPAVVASPLSTRYRNRLTFTLKRLRGGRVVSGFHALGDPDRIVDVGSECLLPEEPIVEVWKHLKSKWGPTAERLPASKELRLTLRSVEGGVGLLVKGGNAGWKAGELLALAPGLRAVWHDAEGGRGPRLIAGTAPEETWEGERLPVEGRAFLQVNRGAAAGLLACVVAHAGVGARAVDAYCGIGAYGRALARLGWSVRGIELEPESVKAARHGAPDGFEVAEGRVEDRLASLLPADLVVLNPPRAGLAEEVPEILRAAPPARAIYVSCDAATLARDLARLRPAYELGALFAFDLFPHTPHVETVAVLHAHQEP